MNSRNKGKAGEREAAQFLRDHGFEARRGQQFSGGDDSPDIIHNVPGVHFEVKRREQMNPWDALEQATDDANESLPVVLWRRNNRKWIVVIDASKFLEWFFK